MAEADNKISAPAASATGLTLDELDMEADTLFKDQLALMDSAAAQILVEPTRGERDRLLIVSLAGMAVSTVAAPSEKGIGKIPFEILEMKFEVATSFFHYGLAAIILYFGVTFALMAYLDVEKWRVTLSSKWLPFEDQNTKLMEQMYQKYQALVDNVEHMKEQASSHFAQETLFDKQVEDLEQQRERAHEVGNLSLSSEIARKIIELHREWQRDIPDLRSETQEIVGQMRSISAKLDDLRGPVLRARQLSRLQVIIFTASPLLFSAAAFVLVILTA